MAEPAPNKRNSNAAYAKGGAAIIATILVGAGTTLTQSMRSEIRSQHQRIVELRAQVAQHAALATDVARLMERVGATRIDLVEHISIGAHQGAVEKLAQMEILFREVETQFRGARDMADARFVQEREAAQSAREWRENHDLRVVGLNAAQWERIKGLERAVFGGPLGPGIGEALGSQ